jgi:hypothetical protein
MRRTLSAVGFAVLASLMIVPHVIISSYSGQRYVWRPFFMQGWASILRRSRHVGRAAPANSVHLCPCRLDR